MKQQKGAPKPSPKMHSPQTIERFRSKIAKLVVLEIVNEPFNSELDGEMKKICYFPAATCKRQVYIFRKEDLDKSEYMSNLCFGDDTKQRVYSKKDAYKFLLIWYVGGQNESKYLQDTYNSRTIKIYLDAFRDVVKSSAEEIQHKIDSLEDERKGNETRIAQIDEASKIENDDLELVKLKNEKGSLSNRNGWLKDEIRAYIQFSQIVAGWKKDECEMFFADLDVVTQFLQGDSKYLMSAKQEDVNSNKSIGQTSLWSHSVETLKSDPDLAKDVVARRREFLNQKADEILQYRTLQPTFPPPLSLPKSMLDSIGEELGRSE